jgi:hypothetical protein
MSFRIFAALSQKKPDKLACNNSKPLSTSLLLGLAVEPGPGIQAKLPRSPI